VPWWGWIIVGAFLLGAELLGVDAAFYLIFIGAAAILVGLLELAGAAMAAWVQWLVFAVLALLSMLLFRGRLYRRFRGVARDYDAGPAGQRLRLGEDLAPGESCRMDFRGTTWTVTNSGQATIAAGETAIIRRIEGATLLVEPVGQTN